MWRRWNFLFSCGEYEIMQPLHAKLSIAFPPFPPTPSGVRLTPYQEFKEHGIRVEKDDNGKEVDGIGIPTAMLPIYEQLDSDFEWDLEPLHRPTPSRSHWGDRKIWWEDWSEQDDKRTLIAFNPYVIFWGMPSYRALILIRDQIPTAIGYNVLCTFFFSRISILAIRAEWKDGSKIFLVSSTKLVRFKIMLILRCNSSASLLAQVVILLYGIGRINQNPKRNLSLSLQTILTKKLIKRLLNHQHLPLCMSPLTPSWKRREWLVVLFARHMLIAT